MTKSTHVRILPETKDRLRQLMREVSHLEKNDVHITEGLRRISNIPNLRDILLSDAKLKARRNNE